MNLKRFFIACACATSLLGIGAVPLIASAQEIASGLQEVGRVVKLPSTDPRVIAVNVINVALGLIGIILVVLLVYAGFLYMTSGGNTEKVEKAKKIILNAIIGLIIILSSWAITRYVLENLLTSTQGDGGGGGGGNGGDGGFGGGGGAQSFYVVSFTPSGNVLIKNVQVKIVFNKAVDPNSAKAILVSKVGGTTVGGTIDVAGSVVLFTPGDACPAPNADKKCFDGDSDFTVKVAGSVKSTQGQTVICNAFGHLCDGKFHTGNLVDTKPPEVSVTYPTDGMKVQQNYLQDVQASVTDDGGIATVEYFDGASSIGLDAPIGDTPLSFSSKISWDTAGAALGAHILSASAADIDTNTGKSSSISVVVRPEHCFNEKQDVNLGETGIDCGGDSNGEEYCGSCVGAACSKNSDCASGFCLNGQCAEKPVIQSVAPLNGKPGTFVTIKGVNFGFTSGAVTFLGAPGAADDTVAVAPQICADANIQTWSSTQVIVAVPIGAASGPLLIENGSSKLSDATNDLLGPQIPNFIIDNSEHPGLCGIDPNAGIVGSQASLIGQGFGVTVKTVLFGDTVVSPTQPHWTDAKVTMTIPVVNSAPYQVSVKTDGGTSNPVQYTVKDKNLGAAPVLQLIDPVIGAQQTYITLQGENFGYSIGQVVFTGGIDGIAYGDVSFPQQCADGYWTDKNVIVKVPTSYVNKAVTQDGTFQVKIKRSDSKESNSLPFTIKSELPVGPGICTVLPSIGPKGTAVTLIGDKFGGAPLVTFSTQQAAVVGGGSGNQLVNTSVPSGAITGPLSLKASGQESNKVLFQVRNCNEAPQICGSKAECCPTGECAVGGQACGAKSDTAEYAWQTSTGLIPVAPRVVEECVAKKTPSPSPWLNRQGGDQVPVDAAVVMRFTKLLKETTVVNANFQFLKCTDDTCKKTDPVPFITNIVKENGDQQVVKLSQPGMKKLSVNTMYLINVLTGVASDGVGGTQMDEMKSCGAGPAGKKIGYCFKFKTKNSDEMSKVGSINVIPNPFYMHGIETENYNAVPIYAGDACVVLECRQFKWLWDNNKDGRAQKVNDANHPAGECEQPWKGVSETGDVPVKISAAIVDNLVTAGMADLFINFVPPFVEAYGPNCDEACINGLVWARFSDKLNEQSVKTPGNVVIQQCANENCVEAELAPPLQLPPGSIELRPPFGSIVEPPDTRLITVKAVNIVNGKAIFLLSPGKFYRVLLRGGMNGGIKGANGVPIAGLNHKDGFTWTFRVKLEKDGAFCVAEKIDVTPPEKIENSIGARQMFIATPFSKPDVCNASGQPLIQSESAKWSTENTKVAEYHKIASSLIDTGGDEFIGCSGNCLATGSIGQYGKVSVCGNGIIETTDTNYCIKATSKTIWGDDCQQMPAGANAGEECEPSLGNGQSCDEATCLWKPVKIGETCGNGKVDATEACDFGKTCVGGSSAPKNPVAELSLCNDANTEGACVAAKGVCAVHDYRGCSSACRHLGSFYGKSTCGNSDYKGDGKDCDDGNATDDDGCSAQCLHEPSSPKAQAYAVCGNGKLEPGEVCDSPAAGQPVPAGCNSITCLHTGSASCGGDGKLSCCGNAVVDPGEDCDDGNQQNGDGCSVSCLFEGSSSNYVGDEMKPSFCTNGLLELGEQCEAHSLSSDRLAAKLHDGIPLKIAYQTLNKSLKQFGDGLDDAAQLGYIVGEDKIDQDGRMISNLSVDLEKKTGTAVYGLQCGFVAEESCQKIKDGTGLDTNSCCSVRPMVIGYPVQGSTGVCRNVQMKATFNVPMDAQSVLSNLEISEPLGGKKDCGAGMKLIVLSQPVEPGVWNWVKHTWKTVVSWFRGDSALAEKWCTGGVTGQLVPVDGDGQKSAKIFTFTLDHALASSTTYLVRFLGDSSMLADTDPADTSGGLGDNADMAKRLGVKTALGAVHPYETPDKLGQLAWTFTTGEEVCGVNVVTVLDATPIPDLPKVAHPYLFVNEGGLAETRKFTAEAQSIQNGIAIPLSPVKEYSWKWLAWTSSEDTIVKVVPANGKDATTATSLLQKNGTSILTATLEVDKDDVNVPSTLQKTTEGVALVTVLACENPWPQLTTAPFRDTESSVSIQDLAPNALVPNPTFDPAYHFSTMYCRDAGEANKITDDVPALRINLVPQTDLDKQRQILRQYLFSYPEDAKDIAVEFKGLQQDGIGIRIIANPQHLSPMEWYRNQGFKGSPTLMSVDGYPALQDGGTVYAAASNRKDPLSGQIYSNIYLISHNPDAKPPTLKIFNEMVKYFTFNINLQAQSNVCAKDGGGPFSNEKVNGGLPVHCSADWECFQFGETKLHCASMKKKLARDTQRMADFQSMTQSLEMVKASTGSYPKAAGGTYVPGFSTSHWNSWIGELGKEMGTIPVDPVNHFLTCGQCSLTQTPCQSASDCIAVAGKEAQTCDGGYLALQSGVMIFQSDKTIDPASCWSQSNHKFYCPSYGGKDDAGVSRTYQYKAISNASFYRLSAEYEVPPPGDLKNLLTNWWYPPLPTKLFKCAEGSQMAGFFCNDVDANGESIKNDSVCRSCMLEPSLCKTCKNGDAANEGKSCTVATDCGKQAGAVCKDYGTIDNSVPSTIVTTDSCRQSSAQYFYNNTCGNTISGEAGFCGDGVLNPGENCEVGMTQQKACLNEKLSGHKIQVCDLIDCKQFTDDLKNPQCIADAVCGNGRLDKMCNNQANGCLTDADCGGVSGACQPSEICDDGLLNGTYGHCAVSCDAYYGYCGDGRLSPGEICDHGSVGQAPNGEYSKKYNPDTCALNCKDVGPYCGDGEVSGSETCDGKPLITQDAICKNTLQPCKTDDDCDGVKDACGAVVGFGKDVYKHPILASCVGWQVTPQYEGNDPIEKLAWDVAHKNDVSFKRDTQHIRSCGDPGAADACLLNAGWTGCEPIGICGDGIKDINEECDDGANNGPTKSCLNTCKKNICGDGFVNTDQQIEECDKGDQNGKTTCVADYNSMCLSCAKTCKFQATSGGYCGDKQKNGPEQCDGSVPDEKLTCKALGYDYGRDCIAEPNGPGCHIVESTKPKCAPSCSFGGCFRCQDNPGEAVIRGTVYDAVFKQVVPGARISLMYKGVKVDEAFTDQNGKYAISTLNGNDGCGSYRLIIDMYKDNVCTGATHPGVNCDAPMVPPWNYPQSMDEGIQGGYFPFTSEMFGATTYDATFATNADGALVFIFPKTEIGKTYAIVTWKGDTNHARSLHVVLPTTSAFTVPPKGDDAASCADAYPMRPASDGNGKAVACTRDVTWASPGSWDIDNKLPNAHLVCLHNAGEKSSISADPKRRGCPIEGVTACVVAGGYIPENCKKQSFDSLTEGEQQICVKCGGDPGHICSPEPAWEDCGDVKSSPVTAWIQYAAAKGANEPIRLYFDGLLDTVGSFTPEMKSLALQYTAYVVIGESLTKVDATKATGSGFLWNIGEIDQDTEVFTSKNVLAGTDEQRGLPAPNTKGGEKPVPGLACYSINYQCNNNYMYCIDPNDDKKVNGRCSGQNDAVSCKNGYKCGKWNMNTYHQHNW